MLSGILEPRETVILSTHLIEEVENFISRAVMLREGKIISDVTAEEIEASGKDLVGFIKGVYSYRPDRVGKAIDSLSGDNKKEE